MQLLATLHNKNRPYSKIAQYLLKKLDPRLLGLCILYILSFNNCGVISSKKPTINSPVPTFTPLSGPIGTLITFSGMDFTTATSVAVGSVSAVLVSKTSSSLVAFVMPGTSTGSISLTTSTYGTTTSTSTFTVTATGVPASQQGTKLIGSGFAPAAYQGTSVSISADGNTALMMGSDDSGDVGAGWIFTRTLGTWTQQGTKLVGSGYVPSTYMSKGSLSSDGNTALIGGYQDNSDVGAAWVFTRTKGTWTQQGNKLVGSGASSAQQGIAVAISADGNTALIGGHNDNSSTGAAWVFTRTQGIWTQQGAKLVGSGASSAQQGSAVAISADGNTALIGGPADNSNAGAAWVFTRTLGTWTQQGAKLVGSSASTTAQQGTAVTLSADGNTALIGGPADNLGAGATWAFTRSTAGIWSQQGAKLVGSGATGNASQSGSTQGISLSADGNTAVIGGPDDNSGAGAIWVFTRSGGTWSQHGVKLVGTGGAGASQGFSVAISADGNTAITGGLYDNSNIGASWIFVQ